MKFCYNSSDWYLWNYPESLPSAAFVKTWAPRPTGVYRVYRVEFWLTAFHGRHAHGLWFCFSRNNCSFNLIQCFRRGSSRPHQCFDPMEAPRKAGGTDFQTLEGDLAVSANLTFWFSFSSAGDTLIFFLRWGSCMKTSVVWVVVGLSVSNDGHTLVYFPSESFTTEASAFTQRSAMFPFVISSGAS